MPICINTIDNENPKIKKEKFSCDVCQTRKLCLRTNGSNICRPCWNKMNKDKTLWCMYCHICGNLFDENELKVCEKCNKDVGYCCGAVYYCQAVECICKKCYDYKCEYCDNILDKNKSYVLDGEGDNETFPICDQCRDKRTKSKKSK